MRVALFFDGKNFYRAYKQVAPGQRIDFPGMANWLVKRVGGNYLWGAYYYTGVGSPETGDDDGQQSLSRFLDMLETQPGFFVKRFPRKLRTLRCPHCQTLNRYLQEKEVDTTMVADILSLAAVGAYDIIVLVSGDADHAPAMEGAGEGPRGAPARLRLCGCGRCRGVRTALRRAWHAARAISAPGVTRLDSEGCLSCFHRRA